MKNYIHIGIDIDLQKLVDTRLLIQAGSGGGKSYALRKVIESVGDSVQQIILDPEGEFVTLREKFDFALVSKGGDIPLNLKFAEMLAHKLLETNLSAIIDLYELKHHERILFVKRFLDALINSPKELWHSCLIYVDEAHIFCPESSKSESMSSVIDLCTRGRKRGFAGVLATQRLSKLHKDAAAECLNKMIGRTGLDIDRKRSGDELGMINKSDILGLRDLSPGEFYGFGPAISNNITKFKVREVKTTHLQAGKRIVAAPPTPNAIKKILTKLQDIPEEAEKELQSKKDFQNEIARLKTELAKKNRIPVKIPVSTVDPKLKEQIKELQKVNEVWTKAFFELDGVRKYINKITGKDINPQAKLKHKIITDFPPVANRAVTVTLPPTSGKITPSINYRSQRDNNSQPGSVTGGALRMLKAAAMYAPGHITKTRMAALARLSYTSGSFNTYLSTLKREGLLVGEGMLWNITDVGIEKAGDVEQLPDDPKQLIELWCGVVGNESGAARILRVLGERYPEGLTKPDLGQEVSMSYTSGSFNTYLSTLKRNGLITVNGSGVKAADELFN